MEYLWGGHGGGRSALPTVWRRCAVIVRRPQELYAWLHVLAMATRRSYWALASAVAGQGTVIIEGPGGLPVDD